MNKYKIMWYNMDSLVKEEPKPINADSENEAIKKAYLIYGGKDNAPAPCISAIRLV